MRAHQSPVFKRQQLTLYILSAHPRTSRMSYHRRVLSYGVTTSILGPAFRNHRVLSFLAFVLGIYHYGNSKRPKQYIAFLALLSSGLVASQQEGSGFPDEPTKHGQQNVSIYISLEKSSFYQAQGEYIGSTGKRQPLT